MKTDFSLTAADGITLACYAWLPSGKPRAVLQLVHGSLEHAVRYEDFVAHLTGRGFAVYACDLRGHGATAATPEELCYFSDQPGGWQHTLADLRQVMTHAQEKHPDLPFFVMGHSMGSFLVQQFICRYGSELSGAVISGTGGGRPLLLFVGRTLSRLLMLLRGRRHKSPFLHSLFYGALNKSVANPKTDYDFLSRDPAQVQAYIDDPRCGTTITTEYGFELTKGVQFIVSDACFTGVPKTLPILLFAGEKCPVAGPNGDAAEIKKARDRYLAAGAENVTLNIYPGARHETLNETNREEVFDDVARWLEAQL
jgi:alpha-beta hydrolase superfamily lysophospholipase